MTQRATTPCITGERRAIARSHNLAGELELSSISPDFTTQSEVVGATVENHREAHPNYSRNSLPIFFRASFSDKQLDYTFDFYFAMRESKKEFRFR